MDLGVAVLLTVSMLRSCATWNDLSRNRMFTMVNLYKNKVVKTYPDTS